GNFGSGRRTLAEKFYSNIYPQVGRIFPQIKLDAFTGLEELYRKFLTTLRPSMAATALRTSVQGFQTAADAEKKRLISQLLNSLLSANEAALLLDEGGVLTDSGAFEPELDSVISLLDSRPHPPVIFVAPRMVPRKLRRPEDDVSYLALKSLRRDASERLI